MRTKVIASVLIYCFILQIPFLNVGCTSFYPVSTESELTDCHNYDYSVHITFKNGTEIKVPGDGFYFLRKDEIDSCKIINYHSRSYKQFWLKDNKTLLSILDNSVITKSDTTSHFYFVKDDNGVYRQIYKNDIEEIQIRKPDGLNPDLPVIGVMCLVIAGLVVMVDNIKWAVGRNKP